MENKLKIRVSQKPPGLDGIVSYKETTMKERLLRKLLGPMQDVTIIVPGKDTSSIEIVRDDRRYVERGVVD